jgi:hypothetical protein
MLSNDYEVRYMYARAREGGLLSLLAREIQDGKGPPAASPCQALIFT